MGARRANYERCKSQTGRDRHITQVYYPHRLGKDNQAGLPSPCQLSCRVGKWIEGRLCLHLQWRGEKNHQSLGCHFYLNLSIVLLSDLTPFPGKLRNISLNVSSVPLVCVSHVSPKAPSPTGDAVIAINWYHSLLARDQQGRSHLLFVFP